MARLTTFANGKQARTRGRRRQVGRATVDHHGHLSSDWWFVTPHGKREVYFDTGTLIDTPGEVARQESARAQYMARLAPTVKVQ
jgi:hypothetical protein